mmetsp:Transcript_38006/g.37503  ORF Transcript_38006/g.37503 Transcript_38006/m.37503 type:complete len:165 (+) Transcript_38006:313-807(+)
MEREEAEVEKEENRRAYHSKIKSYSDTIKNKFGPKISRKKQEEIKIRRQSLEMPAKERYRPKALLSDTEERKKIYKQRMKVYKSLPRKKNFTPQIPQHDKGIDYLQELRKDKPGDVKNSLNTIPKNLVDWKSDIKQSKLDNKAREQRIQEKANILKNEALYKEM